MRWKLLETNTIAGTFDVQEVGSMDISPQHNQNTSSTGTLHVSTFIVVYLQ